MQPAFLLKPARELRVRQCVEQAHHADRDRRLLDKVDHVIRHRLLLAIEADDETRSDEEAGGVKLVDALCNAATGILLLAHCDQRRRIGTLYADEDADKIS